jgi:hypothetical protein
MDSLGSIGGEDKKSMNSKDYSTRREIGESSMVYAVPEFDFRSRQALLFLKR